MSTNGRDIRIWLALAAVYIVWGSTYLAIKIATESIPPLLSGGIRFVVASAVLGTAVLVRKGRQPYRISRRELGGAALVGLLLLTLGNGMVALAEQYISSGLAALLVASVPLWLILLRAAFRDRPHVLTMAGVLVGFAGVAGLSLGGGTSAKAVGIVVILLGSVAWSVGSFLSPRIPMPKDPFVASTVEMIAGGLGLLLLGGASGERLHIDEITGSSLLALAYLVAFGSLLAFTSYVWLLGNAPISLVSTYAYVNPVVAVGLGVLVLDEQVTRGMLVAGVLIVAGVALVVSTERRKRVAEPEGAALRRVSS
ncbi:drug/metabolite exporter YedA [Planotetraspora thailandica]|uniref:Drug/metabolite exporter YedA n=1 Tax=Planotetraspora thailandica TaxID=487172 RepID=A0A8J3XV03_9ACTN|nr:EamA family transporter [Planotetraspora thailandica]GII53794.1 drug/metabolite exporter YedA [Planotetraspora thailandica]